MMSKAQLIILHTLLLIFVGCTEADSAPTIVINLASPTATMTPTITATTTPTPLPTATPFPTLPLSPVAESIWQCDPSGGLACFYDLHYVDMLNANEGWAVSIPRNGKQVVLRYTVVPGESTPSWQRVPSDTFEASKGYPTPSIFMLNETEGWLVGEKGRIAHLVNGQWQDVPSPTDKRLLDVVMISANEGWAVGQGGTLLHYIDNRWEQIPISSGDLFDIEMISDTEGWIVGGTILHYQDGNWQEIPNSISPGLLTSVSMVSADEGWAVHNFGRIFHYIDGEWREVNSPTENTLWSIDMINSDEGWAVGRNSTIPHYYNDEWAIVSETTLGNDLTINDLTWLDNGEGWAVGSGNFGTKKISIIRIVNGKR